MSKENWETLLVYRYNAQGRYSGAEYFDNPHAFVEMLPTLGKHVEQGLELRITDTSDRMLFHAQKGRVVWDGIQLHPVLKEAAGTAVFTAKQQCPKNHPKARRH